MKKNTIIIILFFLTLFVSCNFFKTESKYFEVTAKSGLILRKGPGQNFEKITTLPIKTSGKIIKFHGDTIKIQGKTGRWIEVETDYLKGFLFSGFLIIHNHSDFLEEKEEEFSQFDQNGIVNFIKSNKSQEELGHLFLSSYKKYEKELDLNTKTIFKTDIYTVSMFSLTSPKDPYTNYQSIVLWNQKNQSNYVPEGDNLHITLLAENSKIFYGTTYECYECCAMPSNLLGFLAEENVYAIEAPLNDTEAFCGVDGEYYDDFSQLRITKNNDIIIHRISYDCDFNLKCPNMDTEGGCKPSKRISDEYTLIQNPFKKPKVFKFESKNVPGNILADFKNARKPKINLEIK
ncbi:hypothetical protein AB3N60_10255 [Leptospira sp. WS39.C2]